jgi:hypothetical protein
MADFPPPSGPGLKGHKAFLTSPKPMDRWLREASIYVWPLEWQVAAGYRKREVKDVAWWRAHESGAAAVKRHKARLRNVRPNEGRNRDTPAPHIIAARALEARAKHASANELRELQRKWNDLHRRYWAGEKMPR